MDQRGTGQLTSVTKQILEKKFPDLFTLDSESPSIILGRVGGSEGDASTMATVEDDLKLLKRWKGSKGSKGYGRGYVTF